MTGTYEMIKALPGKTTNWGALQAALVSMYQEGGNDWTDDEETWGYKGIRLARHRAMCIAAEIVRSRTVSSRFIPPSPETLSWGGFLGGETVVLRDRDLEETLTEEIGLLIKRVGA